MMDMKLDAPTYYRPVELVCACCGKAVPDTERVQALERFILEKHLSLQGYKHYVMHQRCFREWEHRRLYIRLFNEYHESIDGDDYSVRMKPNGSIEWHWHHQKHKS